MNSNILLRSVFLIALLATGCSQVHIATKPSANSETQSTASKASNPNSTMDITGTWRVRYQFGNQTLESVLHLAQQGNNLSGDGVDNQPSVSFTLKNGEINDQKIYFQKIYNGVTSQPIEYIGTYEISQDPNHPGPYLHGEYTTLVSGQKTSGEWEAIKSSQPEPQSKSAPAASNKAPDLSGKWQVGYQYNFKTIKSVMFLEQTGAQVTGHGIDVNTKEKFVIEKGSYNFPKLILVRKYQKGKTSRTMAFKGDVTNINDSDYQGPYIKGETQGGGLWEAQEVR